MTYRNIQKELKKLAYPTKAKLLARFLLDIFYWHDKLVLEERADWYFLHFMYFKKSKKEVIMT